MVEAMIARVRIFLLLLALTTSLAMPSVARAHALDEYLQATLVAISAGEIRFSINLTPGVAVADQVLALIDLDQDGVISTNEARAYAELLKRDLSAKLDQRELELKIEACNFPDTNELRTGWGIIQVEFSAKIDSLAGGSHRLEFDNRHQPAASVYLFNATQPSSEDFILITQQNRNKTQSHGEIIFDHYVPKHMSPVVPLLLALFVILAAWQVRHGFR